MIRSLTFSLLPAIVLCAIRQRWLESSKKVVDSTSQFSFFVFLNLENVGAMREEFLSVSTPSSPNYGNYLSLELLESKYGAKQASKETVMSYLADIHPRSVIESTKGDVIKVTTSITSVESFFNTKMVLFEHENPKVSRLHLKSRDRIQLPESVAKYISFTSLDSPVHINLRKEAKRNNRKQLKSHKSIFENAFEVRVLGRNFDALLFFQPICGNGELNGINPPCSNLPISEQPVFNIAVESYRSDNLTVPLNNAPTYFPILPGNVHCSYNNSVPCNGDPTFAYLCVCMTRVSPLPKYQQLRATVSYTFNTQGPAPAPAPVPDYPQNYTQLGYSPLFVLTDTATSSFLSDLYSIPNGLTVKYGANQSVVEFYEQYYSNADLSQFLALSGLANASIPNSNVFGDLPNDQSDPGGEAQLDVEYIMAIAPGAETFFYSFSNLNPYSPENEGFLAYLTYVGNQSYPPLVQSLSYGDIESVVYNTSDPAAYNYAQRCDMEFMKLGLRGISVIFSSGDDGIGNAGTSEDPEVACQQANPAWPASSPYVTTVGGTILTDQYLPICGQNYYISAQDLPGFDNTLVQCTGVGETVCSATNGGLITSGGGFSDVYDRAVYAPWQNNVVNAYLAKGEPTLPPLSYFNASGRAYPDVATYSSSYFVYIGGETVVEYGTSASAPVFAAMVTLWNDIRAKENQPPMGFIAPLLYEAYAANPAFFNDVTTGNNACGAGSSIETTPCCPYSFGASPGWDASSGLGSPNFERLTKYIKSTVPAVTPTSSPAAAVTGAPAGSTSNSNNDDDHNVAVSHDLALAAIVLAAVAILINVALFVYIFKFMTTGSNDLSGSLLKK